MLKPGRILEAEGDAEPTKNACLLVCSRRDFSVFLIKLRSPSPDMGTTHNRLASSTPITN